MKAFAMAALVAAVVASAHVAAQTIDITPNSARPAAKGPPQTFIGSVTIDPLFATNAHRSFNAGLVTFEPGARSAWHTHPSGQTLLVTSGVGWIQQWGGERKEIKAGDVVWIPSGVKHWHGATATTAMSHIAIQQLVDAKNVDWLEQVSDEQYGK